MKVFKIIASIAILGLLSFTTHTTVSSLIWKNETMEIGEIPQGTPKEIIFECKNTCLLYTSRCVEETDLIFCHYFTGIFIEIVIPLSLLLVAKIFQPC